MIENEFTHILNSDEAIQQDVAVFACSSGMPAVPGVQTGNKQIQEWSERKGAK